MFKRIKEVGQKYVLPGILSGAILLGCSKDSGIGPEPPEPTPTTPEPELVLAEEVVIPDVNELEKIVEITDSAITFSEAMNYSKGDILAGDLYGESHGFLRRIESIDGNRIKTSKATLEDAIINGEFNFRKQLKFEDLENNSKNKLKVGVGTGYEFHYPINDLVIYDLDKDSTTTNDQVVLRGDIFFNAIAEVDAKFKKGLKEFYFGVGLTGEANLEAEARLKLKEIDETVKLYEQTCSPISFPGPLGIPIVLRPNFQIYAGVEGHFDAKAVANINAYASLENELTYKNKKWNFETTFDKDFNFSIPEAYLDTKLKGFGGPRLDLIFYESLGPYGQLEEYLRLNVNTKENPWWKLSGGMEAKVGVDMGRFSKLIPNYEKVIWSHEEIIGQAKGSKEPEIVFSATPIEGEVPLTVEFDLSESSATGGINSYNFFFGKGYNSYLEQEGNAADGAFDGITSHTYDKPGNYWAKGEIYDSEGRVVKDSLEIKVNDKKINPIFGSMVDPRDGQEYKTAKIGEQTWMAENLNYDLKAHSYGHTPWVYYSNNPEYEKDYGKMYRGDYLQYACPDGWHIPTSQEYRELGEYLGGLDVAGGKMKEVGYVYWEEPNQGATNESGFGARGGGSSGGNPNFAGFGESIIFWCGDNESYSSEKVSGVFYNSSKLSISNNGVSKQSHKYVRCVKDKK